MVEKASGDASHKKKGRIAVCRIFQQAQPREDLCADIPSFPMLRTSAPLASLQKWALASWNVSMKL